MAHAPSRRPRTNHRRRGPLRHRGRRERHINLSHSQVWFMAILQHECIYQGGLALINILAIPSLLLLYADHRDNIGDNVLAAVITALVNYNFESYYNSLQNFCRCERLDYMLYDIPFQEEDGIAAPQRQDIRFDSWDDFTCTTKTRSNKHKLLRIYNCFGLQAIADRNNGHISVSTGHVNQRGVICAYKFNPEELFLYFMTRMATGNDHTQMCDDIFGGSEKRWSPAWR